MDDQKKSTLFSELKATQLRWNCEPDSLGFKSTEDLKMCVDIIGQERGLNALRMAFDIESEGYNIFVTGQVGTGRKTAVNCQIRDTERLKKIPDDKLYVYNFKNPDTPRLLRLPASQGRCFKLDMEELVELLSKKIPEIFESENYHQNRKEVIEEFKKKQKKMLNDFEAELSRQGFTLIQIQMGAITRPAVLPVYEQKPVNFDQLKNLEKQKKISAEKLKEIETLHEKLSSDLEDLLKDLSKMERDVGRRLKKMDHEFVSPVIENSIVELKKRYDCEKVSVYLDEAAESIIENLMLFRKKHEEQQEPGSKGSAAGAADPFLQYRVNVLVDNYNAREAPVIYETSPSYSNLFGSIEMSADRMGRSQTDFTKIKAGSLLKADGGFLIIEALDLLIEPGVWPVFKRALRNRKVEIMNYSPVYMIAFSSLKPEPIDFDVKIALIGDQFLYQLLFNRDEDFKKIFKLRADFDSVMNLNRDSILDYANFAKRIAVKEKLKPLDKTGVARVVEYGVKLAGKQSKLSTRFNDVADVIREANYWALKEDSKTITAEHVREAIIKKNERSRLQEEKIQEMMEDGSIIIDVEGSETGQVNGLSVYIMGDYSFGRPSRITANVSVGTAGIINIEREAELSGRIHDKGVLIIGGYLRKMFAQNKPLAVSASLCFEQSYGGVDGDSASSTEIYALLSALSDIPLKQSIAVTGSVNQKGEIQPIGGVNEKIEGFFEICKIKGLTGKQGVIIPHQNISDLMLNDEVIAAVKKDRFHIFPVSNITEGIEILTGIPAGWQAGENKFSPGSVFARADKTLREFAEAWKSFNS